MSEKLKLTFELPPETVERLNTINERRREETTTPELAHEMLLIGMAVTEKVLDELDVSMQALEEQS